VYDKSNVFIKVEFFRDRADDHTTVFHKVYNNNNDDDDGWTFANYTRRRNLVGNNRRLFKTNSVGRRFNSFVTYVWLEKNVDNLFNCLI